MTATGMKTNGIGRRIDWLNHTRSMADAPEFWLGAGGAPRRDGYVVPAGGKPRITWRGKPVSGQTAALMWGRK